jgi:tetratricopeptide (TPR) repeat protein
MPGLQKRQLTLLLALGAAFAPLRAPAQEQDMPPPAVEPEAPESDAARLDALFVELAEPGRDDWERVENEIVGIWSKSGSPAMDLLLRRGNEALEAEDYGAALEHFSALTDHAPDFAEGWNGRATTFYLMGEYALSIADVERVLALEPRHFGALSGLAFMLEEMEEPELALEALHMVQKLNPNRPNINDAVKRLEQMHGEADL